ncbi:MAG TPA: DUF3089 domain-containing protein [Chryseolinea sp.]|nr:DUF3089 domain-containing protein [Chryseolinea sp.]HPM29450.1 DUF3089 domain-containing protein [Chryseolinea sp.]
MQRPAIFILLSLVSIACHQKLYSIKEEFSGSIVPAIPDYSNDQSWASLPGKPDAADSIPKNSNLVEGQSLAKADVFFIYPTIFTGEPTNQYQWNADVRDTLLNLKIQQSTILNQASIFNGSCKIYAPYYRQAHLYSFYTPDRKDGEQALDLAYQDVKAAFEYYLLHFNEGRPFVIASHSQGSYHAERLIKEYIDGKPLQNKLVMAYLIGRPIKPDAFENIHACEKPNEVGVWASWNTFSRDFIPRNYDHYFKGALSTNPLLWNSSEMFASKELNKGGVALQFTYAPQLADAQNHDGILWTNKPYIKGRLLLRTKNWHRADMNFFYMNIRENVALRIEKYFEEATSSLQSEK